MKKGKLFKYKEPLKSMSKRKGNIVTSKFILTISLILFIGLVVGATTTITDSGTSTFGSDVDLGSNELISDKINEVYYVNVNDGSDIQTKIDLCTKGCEIFVPSGTYTITSTIDLKNNVTLKIDESATININADVNGISMKNGTSIIGGRILVSVNSYNYSAIYIEPYGMSSRNSVLVKNILIENDENRGTALFINTNNSGSSIVYGRFENLNIYKFDKGIHLLSSASDGSAYANNNWFKDIQGQFTTNFIYLNKTGNNRLDGNRFDGFMYQIESTSGNVVSLYDAYKTYINGYPIDPHNFAGSEVTYYLNENSEDNLIISHFARETTDITNLNKSNMFFDLTDNIIFDLNQIRLEEDGLVNVNSSSGDSYSTLHPNDLTFHRNGYSYIDQATVGGDFGIRTSESSSLDTFVMTILQDGKVGLGTSAFNPTAKFHIKHTNDENGFYLDSSATTTKVIDFYNNQEFTGTRALHFKLDNSASTGDLLELQNDGVGVPLLIQGNVSATICDSNSEGAIYYNDATNKHYGCDGSSWNALY